MTALDGIRVLDQTQVMAGPFCSMLLADMGADVIKIEPPGGDSARRIGPFVDDLPHRDRSLFFWFSNLNKRSLTLDLGHLEGVSVLRLPAHVDFVLGVPGGLEAGVEQLVAASE